MQGEWVISRVFQKTGMCSSSAIGGGKKRSPAAIPEVSSPSSVSLPALLDPSTASTDHESCSYDGGIATAKEHVPCFSTTTLPGLNYSSLLEPPSCLNPMVHNPSTSSLASYGVSALPGLRSPPENLQLPLFLSAVGPPPVQGGAYEMSAYGYAGQWPGSEYQRVGATELDCMWSY